MPALKTLGLVILASFVVSIGAVGFLTFRTLMADREASEALSEVVNACAEVIATGSPREVQVNIPGGYTMEFSDNLVTIDGKSSQLQLSFSENVQPIPSGTHTLLVSLSENRLVVTWT